MEDSQRPEFILLSLQRWLNIVLDLLAAALASSVVALAVIFRDRIEGGEVGMALNIMLVANTTLLRLVENWTELEISLGAVARLKTLEKTTPSESKSEVFEPPDTWPSQGRLELENITASYGYVTKLNLPTLFTHKYSPDVVALRNITLSIHAGQKVIVCGRTGRRVFVLTLL